ncbi:uncharacterized protein LOC121737115 [Aricia agestis]|uniref:uncharacterized protein LOC121737115 n=1 Tax=Aricia agestis TaxID=91739 RepID=UPI001C207A87|nr:uncharacterized protein LOC121737115 [Aricia agestis]
MTKMLCLRVNPASFRLLLMSQKLVGAFTMPSNATHLEAYDTTNEFLVMQKSQVRSHFTTDFNLNYFNNNENTVPKDITNMSVEDIDNLLKKLLQNNNTKAAVKVIKKCTESKRIISAATVKEIFRSVSIAGHVDSVLVLLSYVEKVNPNLYRRNGQFIHYLAKAQCMKGNSDKGLSILKGAYEKYEGLRNFYRIILRELIQDSVLNRSEASVVTFKKYVLEFSEEWKDHYPLVCFWHICWCSDWFSDQMLSNELLETSEALRSIVKERSLVFSANILREFNEDAVVRMLQTLLKYKMMEEYVKVLQVLFAYKLRNKDLKGCTEIVKNCEMLGIALPSKQQGSYIKMLIDREEPSDSPTKSKTFKLQF